MAQTLANIVALTFSVALLSTPSALAQMADTAATKSRIEFAPKVRGVQIDGVSLWLSYAYGASADIDLIDLHPNNRAPLAGSVGLRLGVERSATGSIAGPTNDSPFLDYNALFRATIYTDVIRVDVYSGYIRRTSDHAQHYPAKDLLKTGFEFRWKIAPHVFGLLLKGHGAHDGGAGGIGLYFGWDQ